MRQESIEGVARAMELRGEAAPRAREHAEMAAVHNDAVRQAAADMEAEDAPEAPSSGGRFQGWMQNMREAFSGWRENVQERAAVYWDRWRQGETEQPEPDAHAPPDAAEPHRWSEQVQQERDEPEPER